MYIRIKRLMDIILSFMGCIILSPIFFLIIIGIKLDSKGPVFFKQKRVGKNKKYFNILKFRTMDQNTPKDVPTHLLKQASCHITKVGRILRKTSLDELPQLFNILKGDMSIIGPRPALWNQYDLIRERDKGNSNKIRPGLTGLAQVNGRDELAIDVKAKYDNYYAEHISFLMDLKCFISTVYKVVCQIGIVEGEQQK